jgi:hypothetical protein
VSLELVVCPSRLGLGCPPWVGVKPNSPKHHQLGYCQFYDLAVHLPALAKPLRRRVYLMGVLTTGGRDAESLSPTPGDVCTSLVEIASCLTSFEGVRVLECVGRNHPPVLRLSVTRAL